MVSWCRSRYGQLIAAREKKHAESSRGRSAAGTVYIAVVPKVLISVFQCTHNRIVLQYLLLLTDNVCVGGGRVFTDEGNVIVCRGFGLTMH